MARRSYPEHAELRWRGWTLLAHLSLFAISCTAGAQTTTNVYQAQVSQSTEIDSTSFPADNRSGFPNSMSSGSSSELTDAQTFSSSLSGTNYSTSGSVQVSANAEAGSVGMAFSGSATATASADMAGATTSADTTLIATVTDYLTFFCSSLTAGEPVSVDAGMVLNAALSNSTSIPAYVNYMGGVNASIIANIQSGGLNVSAGWVGSDGLSIDGEDKVNNPSLPIAIPLPLTFYNDSTIALVYTIQMTANASAEAVAPATPADPGGFGTTSESYDVDVTHSLDWAGVTGDPIDEGTGLPVTDWTIVSASGFNYADPVPEPSFPVMTLLLLAIIFVRPRRVGRRAHQLV